MPRKITTRFGWPGAGSSMSLSPSARGLGLQGLPPTLSLGAPSPTITPTAAALALAGLTPGVANSFGTNKTITIPSQYMALANYVTDLPSGKSVESILGNNDVLNVKLFGAKGDNTQDDGPYIQNAIFAALGLKFKGGKTDVFKNVPIYFPRGIYKSSLELIFPPCGGNGAQGNWILGDGPNTSIIKYTGPNSQTWVSGITALWVMEYQNYSRVEGIGLDVTGSNAQVAMINWDTLGTLVGNPNGGSQVSWRDMAFRGGSTAGAMFYVAGEGSEQSFWNCEFSGCTGTTSVKTTRDGLHFGSGLFLNSYNALDHSLRSCRLFNNDIGCATITGTIHEVENCYFHNNALIDFWNQMQGSVNFTGNYSDSQNFACAGPMFITGCTHDPATLGLFFDGQGTRFDQDSPYVTAEGNRMGPNSRCVANSGCYIWLRANDIARADFLDLWVGPKSTE